MSVAAGKVAILVMYPGGKYPIDEAFDDYHVMALRDVSIVQEGVVPALWQVFDKTVSVTVYNATSAAKTVRYSDITVRALMSKLEPQNWTM